LHHNSFCSITKVTDQKIQKTIIKTCEKAYKIMN